MILAIESAGQDTKLWLLSDDATDATTPISFEEWASGRTLADGLLSHIHSLLIGIESDWNMLTGIVIYSGPGSFTSLRIAHTVVNTLAAGLDIKLAGATGEAWLSHALEALPRKTTGEPAWPLYGGEANITKPKH